MIELRWEADIRATADLVFSLLADLRNYDRWLPRSSAFNGTTAVSEGPIAVGTTYIEPGPLGTRYGKVTKLTCPTELDFEQPMTLKPEFFGTVGIRLFHTLRPGTDAVRVARTLQLTPYGPIALVMPLVVPFFRRENRRMMAILKDFAESAAAEV